MAEASSIPPQDVQETVPESGYDQTLFAEDVLFTDVDASADTVVSTSPQPRRKLILLIVLGLFAGGIFLGSLYLQVRRQSGEQTIVIQEIDNEATPQGIPGLERQLSLLSNDIATADPLESPLAFPPVDFRLSLQDATAIQIQQQVR